MDVSIACEAVDSVFLIMVDDVSELVSTGEADGVEDCPPLGPGGDIGEPVEVADGDGREVVAGGAAREDELGLGHPPAAVYQWRQEDLGGGDRVEEAEQAPATVDAEGEGEPSIAGAYAVCPEGDGLELEGAARGGTEARGGRAAPVVVGDDEEQRERLRERASPRRAGPPRAGVALEVEDVADAADELRRQLLPEPEGRHGGSV